MLESLFSNTPLGLLQIISGRGRPKAPHKRETLLPSCVVEGGSMDVMVAGSIIRTTKQ